MFDEAGQLATPPHGKLAGWRRWKPTDCRTVGLLTLLIVLQLAGAVLAPQGASSDDPWWTFLLGWGAMGATLAPPTLLAMWAVFGPQRAAVRLPLALWLVGACGLCVAAGTVLDAGEVDDRGLFVGIIWLLTFIVAQLPLWLLRAVRGWRLECAGSAIDRPPAKPSSQFTLGSLLGWTLAAASLLGAWRWVISDGAVLSLLGAWRSAISDGILDLETVGELLSMGVLVSLAIALAGVAIVALAWILLADGKRLALRIVLGVLSTAGIAGALVALAQFDLELNFIACIEAGTIFIGFVNLAILWACGYRLNRRAKKLSTASRWRLLNVVFRSTKERSFAERKTTFDEPSQNAIAARAPVGGWRFAVALATLLLIAAGMAWSVPHRRQMWRLAAIRADWQRSHVNVSFDESGKLTDLQYSRAATVSEETLVRIAQLSDLRSLNLSHSAIDDRQLALLAPLAGRLRKLTLCGTNLTNAGLKELGRFNQLNFLNLNNTTVTDAGLAHLKSLAELRTLHLGLTDVTDAALVTLAQLPNLQMLDVELTAVSERAAATFEKEHPKIMVEFGASDGELLRSFSGYNSTVFFQTAYVRSVGIARQTPSAKHLHAQGRLVTDTGMATISSITDLEELDLRDSAVTDAGLAMLTKMPTLRRLDLRGSAVTESGAAKLASALPQCEIVR
jgi:hypothetical protein